ncbi:MAG: pilus assembly protein CpaF [Candidatus Paceibacteria bacterium]|jgi:pilus assembly protein CpaF
MSDEEIFDELEPIEDESTARQEKDLLVARRKFRAAITTAASARLRPEAARSERTSTRQQEPEGSRGQVDYLSIKTRLHERLLDDIGERHLLGSSEEQVEQAVHEFVERTLANEELPLNADERERLADELLEETLGVGPLAPLMADPAVTDILVNSPSRIYVERFGRLERADVRFRDEEHIKRVIERLAARVGRRIDLSCPMVDLRLPDGSRVNATIPPISLDSPTISIRRFGRQRLRRDDLLRLGMWSQEMMTFLDFVVRQRKNILIAGGTGAGKSTLLSGLAEAIPNTERIVTIEDTAELLLDQDHLVRMESRPPNVENQGAITTRELLINSLRMRPDRIIVGEVRGGEALDMLQSLNTGHDGGLSTIHANSSRDALSRLETMVLMAGLDLPSRAIREQITSALDILVQVRRYEDGVRRIESITEVAGMEGNTPLLQEIYRFKRTGRKGTKVVGDYMASGIVPRLVLEMRDQGFDFPLELFRKPPGHSSDA